MVSTTMEKTLFIGFGLVIFSVLCVPIYNLMNHLVLTERKAVSFHHLVDSIETGVRVVENNVLLIYEVDVSAMEELRLDVEDHGWALLATHDNPGCFLQRAIRSWRYPFFLSFDGAHLNSILRVFVENDLLHVHVLGV